MLQKLFSHDPPPGLHVGCRVALKVGGQWRQGTILEVRPSPVLFRVRYDAPLPSGAFTAIHGPNHDKAPIALRILGDEMQHTDGPRCTVEFLGGGVVLLRGALSEDQQEEHVYNCLQCLPLQKANGSKLDEKPTPGFVWSYGYDNASDLSLQQPTCLAAAQGLLDLLGHQHHRVQLREADRGEANSNLHLAPLPANVRYKRLWARLYPGPSALGWHRDPDSGLNAWVCNINLGAEATFAWRHQGKTHRVKLASGDALFFNGGQDGLEHAIEEVHEESCPAFWVEAWRSAEQVSRSAGPGILPGRRLGKATTSQAQGEGQTEAKGSPPPFVRVGLQLRM